MRKRLQTLCLAVAVLSSCTNQVPEDILAYLKNCSVETAMKSVNSLGMTSLTVDTNNKDDSEIGRRYSLLSADNINEEKGFTMSTTETYSGNRILLDEESSLYLTDVETSCVYNEEKTNYTYTITKKGYESEDLSGEKKEVSTETTYTIYTISSLINTLFYESNENSVTTGGLYYADFFKTRTKYYQYMSIENETFIFHMEKQGYVTDEETGYYDSHIEMNKLGLLDKSNSFSYNSTADIISETDVNALYKLTEEE